MARQKKNILMVEGAEELRTIPYLVEANGIPWEVGSRVIVNIKKYDGIENLVDSDEIKFQLNGSEIEALGIIVDTDDSCDRRWQSIRNACSEIIANLPDKIPEIGLIHDAAKDNGKPVKFGVWIMPDNLNRGMLETFLAYLVPDNSEPLWQYAQQIVLAARKKGATYKDTHLDKANIYTWLAWQNPPGRQLHNAVMERILDPQHPKSEVFMNWFKTLYSLT